MEEISILRMVPHKVYNSRAASLPKISDFTNISIQYSVS